MARKQISIMPSCRYNDGMNAPQLSVRSQKARDLAHRLSAKEKRPIHAIVEDALVEYASKKSTQSAAAFLKRMQALAPTESDLDEAMADLRVPNNGIDL
jgi:hypothetical protein